MLIRKCPPRGAGVGARGGHAWGGCRAAYYTQCTCILLYPCTTAVVCIGYTSMAGGSHASSSLSIMITDQAITMSRIRYMYAATELDCTCLMYAYVGRPHTRTCVRACAPMYNMCCVLQRSRSGRTEYELAISTCTNTFI